MKKILKEEKGITLVALVITIIVLLILAGVAISTLSGRDNIISKAQKARDDYNDASKKEETLIGDYQNVIEKNTGDGTSGTGKYGIFSGLEGYALIYRGSKPAGTDWYKFTSDTSMEFLN